MALEETYHGGHTPNIGTGAPFAAQDDFWGSILSRLDVVCEVVPDPAGVSKIGDLNGDLLESEVWCAFGGLFFRGCGLLVETDAGHFFGEEVASTC